MPSRASSKPASVPPLLAIIAEWSWRLLVAAAAGVVACYVLLKLFVIVVPVVIALFIASILEPACAALRRRKWHRALAASVVFFGALAMVVLTLIWIGTSVAHELSQVGNRVEEGLEEVRNWLDSEAGISRERLEELQDQVTAALKSTGGAGVAGQVISGAQMAVQFVGGLILTLFTLFFVLKDGERMGAWIIERTPEGYREDARAFAISGQNVMRQFLTATAITGFIDAVLIALALLIIGVPLVLALGVLTFIGGFFPIVGATAAGLVATLVALVSNGPGDALLVLGATIIVQQIEGNLLQPLVLGPQVRLHALVTVLAVAAGLAVGGILGAFLSVPIVAFLVRIGHFYRVRPSGKSVAAITSGTA